MNKIDEAVLRLTRSGVTHFDGDDAHSVWQQAYNASGCVGALHEFIDAAKRRGLMANDIRGIRNAGKANEVPGLFRLYVPCTGRGGFDGRS